MASFLHIQHPNTKIKISCKCDPNGVRNLQIRSDLAYLEITYYGF